MDPTTRPDDDVTKSPSSPEVMSKSTNISQSKTKLTDSGSHQATSGPTLQGRSSYATIAKTISNERLDSAASASPWAGALSSRPSRMREARPTDNQLTDAPAALSKDHQATMQRGDISKFDVEVGSQPRVQVGHVSFRVAVLPLLVILINGPSLQLPTDADNTRAIISHPISSPNSSDISAYKETRAAQREGVASPGPILLTSSMQRTTQTRLVTVPPSLALPSQVLPGTGSSIPLGAPEPGERAVNNESLLHQVDPSRERNATRPRAQQVDRTASVQQSVKPFISSPPLNLPTASMSPLPSRPVPALAKTASNRVHTARGMLPDDSQARSRGASHELTHHRSGERQQAPPDEQSRINPSGPPHRAPSPPDDHGAVATELPSQPQPVSVPHRLDTSNSRLRGSDGVHRGAQQATEGPTSDKKERKGATMPEEYEGLEDSASRSDGTTHRKAKPNLTTSYTPDVIQHSKTPAESSVGRTDSSNPSRENDSSAPRLLKMGESREKVGQSSDSTPPLGRKETPIIPPPLALVSTHDQPKHIIRVPSNDNSTVFSVNPQPNQLQLRSPSVVGESHIPVTPFRK